jgi:hypothetical protein
VLAVVVAVVAVAVVVVVVVSFPVPSFVVWEGAVQVKGIVAYGSSGAEWTLLA